ncbi:MAG: hypothetical protein EBU46_00680 [Nitrosomonadaceae bacterium]|nr:hypothetical protein [Nitrosomonadaceae bacterium]
MTVHEFQSKVNLPALHNAVKGDPSLAFKKVPKFGWVAYSKDYSTVSTLFDFFRDAPAAIYRHITKNHSEFQENKMEYSEKVEQKLQYSFYYEKAIEEFYRQSREEAVDGRLKWKKGESVKVTKLIEDLGLHPFITNGLLGVCTEKMVENSANRYYSAPMPLVGKLIIPTFYAPTKVATLESRSLFEPSNETLQLVNTRYPVEKGWYGELNKRVVSTLNELYIQPGNTWDRKADLWTEEVLQLSPQLNVGQCLEIWRDSRYSKFVVSPLQWIRDKHGLEKVKEHLHGLTHAQIKELEKETGESLVNYWEAQNQAVVEVSGVKFLQRNDHYYIIRQDREIEYTNFTIQLTKIVKKAGQFFLHGFIQCNNKEIPFITKRGVFSTYNSVMKELMELFLETGLGIPTVSPNFKHYIGNVIFAFNPEIPFESVPVDIHPPTTGQPAALHS